jgi:hypothetical protein
VQTRVEGFGHVFWNLWQSKRLLFCMLRLVAGTLFLLLMGLGEALAAEETKKDHIGP